MTAVSLAPIALGGVVIGWGFMGLAFWILLVALIVLLVRGTRTPARDSGGGAVSLLEERYARGEITREDFLERRAVLGGSYPDAGPDGLSSR
jgi:putative membrane protein